MRKTPDCPAGPRARAMAALLPVASQDEIEAVALSLAGVVDAAEAYVAAANHRVTCACHLLEVVAASLGRLPNEEIIEAIGSFLGKPVKPLPAKAPAPKRRARPQPITNIQVH